MTTETVNTFEPEAANAQHENLMLAVGEELERKSNPDRPEWLPEKFSSPEDMAQAYANLERRLGSESVEDSQEFDEELQADFDYIDSLEDMSTDEMAEELDAEAETVTEVLDSVGLDFSQFQEEYLELGGLSDEAYNALAQAGFDRSLVDSWIAGQEALADRTYGEVYAIVGGPSEYDAMTNWASHNLTQSEIDAYNANVESGDPALIRFAVNGMAARYRSEVGNEPRLIQGSNTSRSSGAFESTAELTAAMRDPRYHNDPAYRKTVADKLARSSIL